MVLAGIDRSGRIRHRTSGEHVQPVHHRRHLPFDPGKATAKPETAFEQPNGAATAGSRTRWTGPPRICDWGKKCRAAYPLNGTGCELWNAAVAGLSTSETPGGQATTDETPTPSTRPIRACQAS